VKGYVRPCTVSGCTVYLLSDVDALRLPYLGANLGALLRMSLKGGCEAALSLPLFLARLSDAFDLDFDRQGHPLVSEPNEQLHTSDPHTGVSGAYV
jgi:hypothetical protein